MFFAVQRHAVGTRYVVNTYIFRYINIIYRKNGKISSYNYDVVKKERNLLYLLNHMNLKKFMVYEEGLSPAGPGGGGE